MKLLNIKNNIFRKLSSLFIFLMLLSVNLFGQDSADFVRSIGKMNVVIAVIITIFIGLIVFLIYMERRLSKIEKHIDSK